MNISSQLMRFTRALLSDGSKGARGGGSWPILCWSFLKNSCIMYIVNNSSHVTNLRRENFNFLFLYARFQRNLKVFSKWNENERKKSTCWFLKFMNHVCLSVKSMLSHINFGLNHMSHVNQPFAIHYCCVMNDEALN